MENILNKSKGKWLCNANNICNKIEAEIQLSEATKIAFINIGIKYYKKMLSLLIIDAY